MVHNLPPNDVEEKAKNVGLFFTLDPTAGGASRV